MMGLYSSCAFVLCTCDFRICTRQYSGGANWIWGRVMQGQI